MRILFLQKRPLFPLYGGKIRTFNILKHLCQWHDITYLCNVQGNEIGFVDRMTQLGLHVETIPWKESARGSFWFYRDLALNLLSSRPFTVDKDYDVRLKNRAIQLHSDRPFDLVVCDYLQMARNAMGLSVAAKVLFTHNVESRIFRRHAEADQSLARRWFMSLQYHKMQRFESQAGRCFDAVIAVSPQDKAAFEAEYGWPHVQCIDTSVDLDYFRPFESLENTNEIVFVGTLDWLPNVDGLTYFVQKIWPLIRCEMPDVQFRIVGRNPSSRVRSLGGVDGVEVVGTVADVRPFLATAALVVVPIYVGSGTRLKIFEAMSMQKAVVSTPLGAEGLPVVDGEHLLIADGPTNFAKAVCTLLADGDTRARLAGAARALVAGRYGSEQAAKQFDQICRRVGETAVSANETSQTERKELAG